MRAKSFRRVTDRPRPVVATAVAVELLVRPVAILGPIDGVVGHLLLDDVQRECDDPLAVGGSPLPEVLDEGARDAVGGPLVADADHVEPLPVGVVLALEALVGPIEREQPVVVDVNEVAVLGFGGEDVVAVGRLRFGSGEDPSADRRAGALLVPYLACVTFAAATSNPGG